MRLQEGRRAWSAAAAGVTGSTPALTIARRMAELSDAYQVARRQVQARCLDEACRSCSNAVNIAIRNGVCTSRLVHKTTVEVTGKQRGETDTPSTSATQHPAAQNIERVSHLESAAIQRRSRADRLSDAITRATGSTPFAAIHIAWFTSWLLANTGSIPGVKPFDPYPFSFLTLVVSLEAIFLSVFVLMSQNRMTRHAEKRAHLDLQINLLAEQELTAMLAMQRAICRKLDIEVEVADERLRRLLEETDIDKLAAHLEQRLPTT